MISTQVFRDNTAIGSKHFCQFGRANRVDLFGRTFALLLRILHHRRMLSMLPELLLGDFATFDFVFNSTWPCDPAEMQLELLWSRRWCSRTPSTSSPPSSRPRTCSTPFYLLCLAHLYLCLHSAALLPWIWRRGVGSRQHHRCSGCGQCFTLNQNHKIKSHVMWELINMKPMIISSIFTD